MHTELMPYSTPFREDLCPPPTHASMHAAHTHTHTCRAETHGDAACSLRMLLVVEPVQELILADLMPINALRNLAMLAADTPLEMMLDVDLVPSSNLAGRFLGGEPQAARRRQLSAAAVAAEEEAEEGGDAEWEDAADPGTPGEAEALGRWVFVASCAHLLLLPLRCELSEVFVLFGCRSTLCGAIAWCPVTSCFLC